VEALYASRAHDQEFAIDRSRQPQSIDQVGKASRNILAAARVEPCNESAILASAGNGLDTNAIPFPLPPKLFALEAAEIPVLDRMGEHRGAERSRITA